MFRSIIFAFQYKSKISTPAFFYRLNGGRLPEPELDYSDTVYTSSNNCYIQSYLDSKKLQLRIFTSYCALCPGLVLATKRCVKDKPTTMRDFYLETLEGLTYYG